MVWMAPCSSLPSHFPHSLHHQSTHLPISTLNFSSGNLLFSTRGNHLPSRTRFHTNFARSDTDANQSSQSVQGDATSVATPSSSFLSVLCPLLKFFGVRIHLLHLYVYLHDFVSLNAFFLILLISMYWLILLVWWWLSLFILSPILWNVLFLLILEAGNCSCSCSCLVRKGEKLIIYAMLELGCKYTSLKSWYVCHWKAC